jgi:hypothetical protein
MLKKQLEAGMDPASATEGLLIYPEQLQLLIDVQANR